MTATIILPFNDVGTLALEIRDPRKFQTFLRINNATMSSRQAGEDLIGAIAENGMPRGTLKSLKMYLPFNSASGVNAPVGALALDIEDPRKFSTYIRDNGSKLAGKITGDELMDAVVGTMEAGTFAGFKIHETLADIFKNPAALAASAAAAKAAAACRTPEAKDAARTSIADTVETIDAGWDIKPKAVKPAPLYAVK